MMLDNAVPPERFSRDMGITHREFHRTLPGAVRPYEIMHSGERILVQSGPRKLVITLHPENSRRIASLALPSTQVDFAFMGFDDEERRQFMRRFDLCYQRGGG